MNAEQVRNDLYFLTDNGYDLQDFIYSVPIASFMVLAIVNYHLAMQT